MLGAIGAMFAPGRLMAGAGSRLSLSGRCRVEVIRCQCFSDLQGRYLEDPDPGPCGRFRVGDSFEITPSNFSAFCKEGRMCQNAWRVLEPYVLAALSEGETVECASAMSRNQAVVCCPDGTRPVVFKVTAL